MQGLVRGSGTAGIAALISVLTALAPAAKGHEAPTDLLAHFTFDDTLADASGNGFDGEAITGDDRPGSPVFVDGKYGQALWFEGAQAVLVPLDLHRDEYPTVTITGWVHLRNDDAGGVLVGTGSGDGPKIQITGDDIFAEHAGGRNQANNALRPGRWFFFAGTWDYDAGTVRLNWRARSQQESFDPTDLDAPAPDLFIGALNERLGVAARELRLDDIRIYARALTAEELVGLRLGPAGDQDTGPIRQAYPESGSGLSGERVTDDIADALGVENITTGQPDPEEADRGERRVVVFDGSRSGNRRTRYTLTTTGEIRKAEGDIGGFDATINDNDEISGNTASGLVGAGVDAYYVYGEIRMASLADFEVADVYVDGQRLTHRVVFDGTKGDGRTRYKLFTTRELIQAEGELDGMAVTINPDDTLDGTGTNAQGYVGSARDGYLVFGEIGEILIDDPTALGVVIDGIPLPRFPFDEGDSGRVTVSQPAGPGQTIVASGGARGSLEVEPTDEHALHVEIDTGSRTLSDVAGSDLDERLGEYRPRGDYIKADLVDHAMHTLTLLEEQDRPCEVIVGGYTRGVNRFGARNVETARSEVCEGDGGNERSRKSVSLSSVNGVIRQLRVCRPEPPGNVEPQWPKARIKGMQVRGETLDADGRLTGVRESNKYQRSNCDVWDDRYVSCPSGYVATGVRQHVHEQSGGKYSVGGVQLICRRVKD